MPADYAPLLDELDGARRHDDARAAQASSPPRPMPAPPPTTPRSPTGSRDELGDDAPAYPRVRRQARRGAALRREPAPDARRSTAAPEQRAGVATARQVQGKQLSYNNINDTDAAYECVAEFDPARTAACVIVKHANPCGVAEGASLVEAYRKALACDPVSAFGGIVALNRTLDAEAARAITEIFTEVIIAPDATEEADRHRRREEESAAAARRRPARSARGGPHGEVGRRRPAGAVARQRRGRRHGAEGRDQARADRTPSCATCASPSASPST